MNKFEDFRMHVPAARRQTYLSTASTGLIPDFVYEAVNRYQENRYQKGGNSNWLCSGQVVESWEMMEWSKAALARMIGTEKENIVFGQNSTHVYTLFTGGLEFAPGDNIILPEGGWMGIRYASQIRQSDGLKIRYAKPHDGKIEPEDIFALCDERTKAVCVPLVEPETGFLMDVTAIGNYCQARGIWLAVDGVQGLGILPVNVEKMNIDFLTGNDYKWLMNYGGTGYGYISPALQEALKQRTAGWMGNDFSKGSESLNLKKTAGRFEMGFPAVSSIYGVGLVAEKYCELGGSDIQAHVFGLIKRLKEGLSEIDGVRMLYEFPEKNQSAITVLLFEANTGITNEMLERENIIATLKPYGNEGRLTMRISLHYYNNQDDVERLLEVIGSKGSSSRAG